MSDTWNGLDVLLNPGNQGGGVLPLADIDTLFHAMWEASCPHPCHLLLVSLEDARRIRHLVCLATLYQVNPRPPRLLRKCFLRKRQAALSRGRQRIRRIEQKEHK